MASHHRVAIYGASATAPHYYTKPKHAKELVASGNAKFIDVKSVRLIEREQVAPTSNSLPGGSQGSIYHSAAIELYPKFFQGGLNRTEHKPEKFSKFANAKVGHQ